MIEIKNLVVQTKGFSLKGVSLTVQTGSCHALLGPTGCGKTTLLESVLGLRKIKEGKVILDGKDITSLPVHQRGFSYVPQDLAIFPHLTVQENIFYGIRHGSISEKETRYKAGLQIAEQLGISHLLGRKAFNLSGGERQRVALARALAPGHRYLLLDEPLSALHEGMKKELWFLLKDLQRRYDLTILMVSHDLEETFFLADYVSVMIDGEILQSDEKERLYKAPSKLEVARFFGIKNLFKADIKGEEDGHYRLYCDDLKSELLLPVAKLNRPTAKVTLGIRSEDVMILRPDLPMQKINLVAGTIMDMIHAGSKVIVSFSPLSSDRTVEIVMPEFAYSKLQISRSMQVGVVFKSERLFVLD